MVKNNNFDFIIGSSHITNGKDMSMDPTFFKGKTRNKSYNCYLDEVLENIEIFHDYFDVYGNLDYVVRNPKTNDEEQFLIKYDKGIEINTSGIRYGLGMLHLNIDILKVYKNLG